MFRYYFLLLAFILLLADGLLAGLWTNRWRTPGEISTAVSRLERLPIDVGEWQGTRLSPFSDRIAAQAGFAGHLRMRFENRRTGAVVNVMLACGPFGPLCVHTPEVCFAGGGFVQEGNRALHSEEMSGPYRGAKLWRATFAKPNSTSPEHVTVFWGWNSGRGWEAPDHPRLHFGGAPVLYKLYLTSEGFGAENTANCRAVIQVLLPELEKSLAFQS